MTSATRGAIPLPHPIKSGQMVVDSTEKKILEDIPEEKSIFFKYFNKMFFSVSFKEGDFGPFESLL